MSLKFGVKVADAPEVDPQENAGGGGIYIKYFKDGVTTLRIAEEHSSWTRCWMHFSQSKKIEYPCTGERETCPGHNSYDEREAKASLRFITNAINRETGYMDLYKIPSSIEGDFARQADKYGTLLDRDYEVIREKNDRGTSYSIDRLDPEDFDFSEHTPFLRDHQEALEQAFRDVWGGLPDEDDYTGGEIFGLTPKPKKVAAAPKAETSWSDPAQAGPPPFNGPDSHRVERDQELTEAQLRAMDRKELLGIYEITGVKVPKEIKKDKAALVSHLINELS